MTIDWDKPMAELGYYKDSDGDYSNGSPEGDEGDYCLIVHPRVGGATYRHAKLWRACGLYQTVNDDVKAFDDPVTAAIYLALQPSG